MADKSFGLVRSFHVDNGELDGESPQQCFMLGYELAKVDAKLKYMHPCAFMLTVSAANRERIEESLKLAKRRYKLTYMHNDRSEGWMTLEVDADETSDDPSEIINDLI